ncbi:response regulator transcription factor [Sediminibacterium roseum]|uniref:Response regulator transcription factor n=1 Tax=Sediminibacterium roseum TaxID=1978412 RepID=A0ABX0A1Q3_9BACT|nr:response regulator transcription factor [Sediminibacterium roseum]NCI51323.1 response regulator transcription factor [Sediminibacterium roseum]
MNDKIKIILADDHQVFIDGMLLAFSNHPDYEIVATFKNGEQLVRGARLYKPDIVLTDISMPVMNGIDAIEQIRRNDPDMLCIVLTNFDSDHLILNSLEAGAFSYVNKIMDKEVIFLAIEKSLRGEPHYCDSTSQRVLRMIHQSSFVPGMQRTELFNTNEKKIIALFCKDKLVKEIADELCLGNRTVERYKANIMEKMGVKTAAGIVMYAVKNKLVIPDDSGI